MWQSLAPNPVDVTVIGLQIGLQATPNPVDVTVIGLQAAPARRPVGQPRSARG
jgi:hypothetical protein